MARIRWTAAVAAACCLAVLAGGCGGSGGGTVSGAVSYDGQPVGDGTITFLPADGKGPTVGGPIAHGRYSVADVPPGPKVVQITAVKAVKFAQSSEEMARQAAERKAKGDPTGLIESADVIPAKAGGNNATVDVKPGRQTRDFALTKPDKPAGR